MWVGPTLADCVGVGPIKCMQVRYSEDEEWQNFFNHIDGFEYVEGWTYKLRVNITEVENPPADASALNYELIDVELKLKDPTQHQYAARPDLYTKQWRLRAYIEDGQMTRLGVDQHVTLEVERNTNKVSGTAGCNNYFGQAKVSASEFSVSGIGSTKKMCSDPAIMEVEKAYLELLEKVVAVQPDRSIVLTLVTSDSVEMRFIPDPKTK